VKDIALSNVTVSYLQEDQRPPFVLHDVQGADFINVKAQHALNVPVFALQNVGDFSAYRCRDVPDTRLAHAEQRKL